MPPHAIIRDFLPEEDRSALLKWVISRKDKFRTAAIFSAEHGAEEVDPEVRATLNHVDVGPFERLFTRRLTEEWPRIAAGAGYSGPQPASIEYQINAYGDGGHFAPHVDIPVGPNRRSLGKEEGEDRVISAVYYFYREPRGFSGGALRLYPFGTAADGSSDEGSLAFEPDQNSLLVFPSWAKHGVDPVTCPSGAFADHRFAINCWFCRRLEP